MVEFYVSHCLRRVVRCDDDNHVDRWCPDWRHRRGIDEDARAPLSQMQKHNNLKVYYTVTKEVLNALGIAAQ
ncbi:hypothetical protein [Rhizobium laguerreae]|uniref:hypothetical protein n=1 Tax=Rhizobium laguerreae TaxID=1076926 RepID=UPI001FEE4CFA|nr:hypothetical protein [Rhizobium laguerreae]